MGGGSLNPLLASLLLIALCICEGRGPDNVPLAS